MRRVLRYYLPAIVWTALILFASTDAFSSLHTGRWLSEMLRKLFGRRPPDHSVDELNFLWRKATHVIAYGILGALWFRALRADTPVRWLPRWAWKAIAIAASVATVDEIHQIFVPSRTASVSDVLLDTGGAALAQALIRLAQVLLSHP
jgi:VanZ family protein